MKRRKEEKVLKDRIFTNPMPLRERMKEKKEKGLGNVERNMEGEQTDANPNGVVDPHTSRRGSNTV